MGDLVSLVYENKTYKGMIIDLRESVANCLFFENIAFAKPGQLVITLSKPTSVQITSDSLGLLVDCLGYTLVDLKAHTSPATQYTTLKMERPAPGISLRERINQPLHTGNILIDSLFPIGRGQRELIVGDRQTGKSTVAVNTILAQKHDSLLNMFKKNIYCIYVAIGQKKSNVVKLYHFLFKTGCLHYTIVLSVSASEPASLQYLAPYAGCSMAEYFRDRGQDTLVIYDDLSKQATAYRQISLLLKRPPGREAYPGDIFYLHARLLERAGKLSQKFKNGSLTALPIIETLSGDISAYIPTNVISITDGQIFLDNNIFNGHYKPAVNIELSVSRIGSKAQIKLYRKVSVLLKRLLIQYIDLISAIDLSEEVSTTKNLYLRTGERLFVIINHRRSICVELQFFFIILVLTGILNKFHINQVKTIVNTLTIKHIVSI